MNDDAEHIRKAQGGDDEAFGVLVHTYIDSVYAFCRQYLGSAEEAEDATQEAFVKAWRALPRFSPEKPLKPWLFAIAKNAATDLMRKRRGIAFSHMQNDEDDRDFAETVPDTDPLPDELFATTESTGAVRQAIAKLAPRERVLLELRYVEGLSFEEIAETLSLEPTTARSVHFRALGKLRHLLEERSTPSPNHP